MMFRKTLNGLLTAAAFSLPVHADDYVEWVGANSGVNWSAAQVVAEGAGAAPDNAPRSTARMLACRAAIVDAQRNLLESIQGVRVEGTTVVADMMVESDTIKTTVSGVLSGARVLSRTPDDDGGCTVQMSAPMGGALATAVYDNVLADQAAAIESSLLSPALGVVVDKALTFLVPLANAAESGAPDWQTAIDRLNGRISALESLLTTHPAVVMQQDAGPTGLVLDARGSNFIPSMSPAIRKLRAGIIYPSATHRAARRDRGQLVSLFTRDLDTARRHPVVGERPVVLKGLRTFGDTRTEIVLGTESSERLEKLVADGFLDDAGVIIVL